MGWKSLANILVHWGGGSHKKKLKRLLPSDIQLSSDEVLKQNVSSIKMEPKMDIDLDRPESDQLVWVKYGSLSLTLSDKKSLKDGNDLNDMHINFGQNLIKNNTLIDINGLKSSLIITKRSYHYPDDECNGRFLQVIHTGNHWIIASNLGGEI